MISLDHEFWEWLAPIIWRLLSFRPHIIFKMRPHPILVPRQFAFDHVNGCVLVPPPAVLLAVVIRVRPALAVQHFAENEILIEAALPSLALFVLAPIHFARPHLENVREMSYWSVHASHRVNRALYSPNV